MNQIDEMHIKRIGTGECDQRPCNIHGPLPTSTGGTGQEEKPLSAFHEKIAREFTGSHTPEELAAMVKKAKEAVHGYEFVTKEEVEQIADFLRFRGRHRQAEAVTMVLSERDAFREVANDFCHAYHYRYNYPRQWRAEYIAEVEAEAKRLLSEKNGGKS